MELNVSRLAGVVVAYDRVLGEQMPDKESMFRGVNFVFDGRFGRKGPWKTYQK
jgi:predicted sulfurtransferase